jgi:hypothetical protein
MAHYHVFAICGIAQHQIGIGLKNVILNHIALKKQSKQKKRE